MAEGRISMVVMTATSARSTVLLLAVNRFMALAIEREMSDSAVVQRAGWSDEELEALCDRGDILAIVIDVTFLNEDLVVQRLIDQFDCPVIAVRASDSQLRINESESSRRIQPGEPLVRWLAGVAGRS